MSFRSREAQPILTGAAKAALPTWLADLHRQTMHCRATHDCFILPYEDGPLLGVLAAAHGKSLILELGAGLGYSTMWLAHGSKHALIDTIEHDPIHAQAARDNFVMYGIEDRVTLYEAEFSVVLPTLAPGYDLIFFDGWAPCHLDDSERLVRRGGVLISSNMGHVDSLTDFTEYRERLFGASWQSAYIDSNTIMSVRL